MQIGELAEKSNTSIETIRYYERIGLIPKAKRTHSGYRHYTVMFLKHLHFIKRSKKLGFTLKEIQELLSLRLNKSSDCQKIHKIAESKLFDIENRLRDLRRIHNILIILLNNCKKDDKHRENCSILDSISPNTH